MKKITLLTIVLFSVISYAQVGINTNTPDSSSALDIESTTGGILIPRLTETQRDAISSPATGLMIYQTDQTTGFYFYDGNAWTRIEGVAGPQGEQGPQGLQGDTGAQGLQGPTGPQGPQGLAGADGATGPVGLPGETGATGPAGPTGPQGPQGPQGVAGNDGADGSNGSSAYEIWIAAGNTGTEAEFLASLVGAQGETGVQGPQGIQGETGATGPAGPQGETGVVSVTNSGGDGSIAYNSSTKVISYTGPSSNETRAHFSAGTGVTLTDGTIAIGQAVGTTDDVTFAHGNFTGNVTSSGGSISGFDASLNDQTGTTYTLVSTDNGKVITLNNSNGITLTVPSGLGSGFNCLIIQKGTGQIFISASGTTLINRQGHTKTAGQYAVVSIVNIGNNTIILGGDTGI